jgi:hypothetical protein
MPRKLWTSPNLPFFKGTDAYHTKASLVSLNEYLRQHVGYWQEVTGTTDANGRVNFTIDCGFKPASVLAVEHYVAGSAHDMGPFHLHTYSQTHLDVHFLTKSGQDRAAHEVKICYMMLPDAGER